MARYTGKYTRRNRGLSLFSWAIILLAVLSLSTGTVAAYLTTSAPKPVINTFAAETQADPSVTEEAFDGVLKKNVSVNVGNTGYSVYVRAAILITWKNGTTGQVLPENPVSGQHYTLDLGDGWSYNNADGYYYYNQPVPSGQKTDVLIKTCQRSTTPDPVPGYTLNVEIITQTIQALGTTDGDDPVSAVYKAWGSTPIDSGPTEES